MTAVIAGLTEPTDLCDAGFVCVSGANNSRPTDAVTGYECPPGYYCPPGSDQETGCQKKCDCGFLYHDVDPKWV